MRRPFLLNVILPILCCFVVLGGILWQHIQWNEAHLRLAFDKEVGQLSFLLEERIEDAKHGLGMLVSFFRASEKVEREEFLIFAEQVHRHLPETQAVEWAPIVRPQGREQFESDLIIRQQEEDGRLERASEREVYAPITYVYPFELNQMVLGFDLMSNGQRRSAMLQARDSGKMVATERIHLLQDEDSPIAAFLWFAPIYENRAPLNTVQQRRQHHLGFVLLVLRLEDILGIAWRGWRPKHIGVRIEDVSEIGHPTLIYHHQMQGLQQDASFSLDVGGRRWALSYFMTPQFREVYGSSATTYIGVAGMMLISLLSILLVVRYRQVRLIEQLNTELKAEEKRLQAVHGEVLAGVEDAVMTLNTDGEILTLNLAGLKMFRIESCTGRMVNDLIPSFSFQRWVEIEQPCFETEALTSAGERLALEVGFNAIPIAGESHYLLIIRDITARKSSEKKLIDFMHQLERSNQELDEFAYIASHDLKEPLRGISNYSYFLLEDYGDLLDEDGKHKLRTLRVLSKRMEELIDSLLYFSTLGQVDSKIGSVSPTALVEGIRDSLQVSLEQEKVDLEVMEELPQTVCDRIRVQEVFRNLITNSIKYNDKEYKKIQIGWTPYQHQHQAKWLCPGQKPPEEGGVVYFVRDNGIGIPEGHLETVFKLFKRLHGRDKYGGGHGAGLSIVKKVIEQHGGIIWIASKPGQGTTFFFTLPHAPQLAPAVH